MEPTNRVTGDLLSKALDGHFDIIAHGCNCQNTMEKGVALAIKRVFPEAWKVDQLSAKGDRQKMGSFSRAWVTVKGGKKLLVVNLYTQLYWGEAGREGDTVEERQTAIAMSAMGLADLLKKNAQRAPWKGHKPVLGIPRIGAGLAGGNWESNRSLIVAAMGNQANITEVHFPLDSSGEAGPIDERISKVGGRDQKIWREAVA